MEMQVTPTFNGVAEIELLYRTQVKPSLRPTVSKSQHAYEIFLSHWDMNKMELQEQFKILMLNTTGKVIGIYESTSGGSTQCIVDIRLVFACALKANAKRIILCHNHPSGNLTASEADLHLTRRMIEAGKLLEIPVIDHLIICSEGYTSFADEGLL
jgi:DNA repair protein RadC